MRVLAFVLALLGAVGGCSSEPDESTPAGALRLFLDAMDRSDWDARALEDAYRLLSPEARARLEQRARRASSLAGRDFDPWDMLVQGRFRWRFAPRESGGMEERIEGDRATVIVRGSGEGQRAEVPMVREGGEWRIDLRIPAGEAAASR